MLSVKVYEGEREAPVGTIMWDTGNGFTLAPAGEPMLQAIMGSAIALTIDDKNFLVKADEDPVVFMQGLCREYKGSAVRCSECEDDEFDPNAEGEEDGD